MGCEVWYIGIERLYYSLHRYLEYCSKPILQIHTTVLAFQEYLYFLWTFIRPYQITVRGDALQINLFQ